MNNVYIRKEDLNSWIAKYFKEELISIDDLIAVIEDLDGDIDKLKDKINELKNNDD